MTEFNKTCSQLSKSYNIQFNTEIIDENKFTDTIATGWNKAKNLGNKITKGVSSIWNIIMQGPKALLKLVTGWFDNLNENNAKSYSNKITNLINKGNNQKIINEGVGDWFKKICNQISQGINLMKSDQEKQKFKLYLQNEKHMSPKQIKNISFADCKANLKDFTDKELATKNIVTENILQKDNAIITELATVIGFTVCFCVVISVCFIVWKWLDNTWGITPTGKANKEQNQRKAQRQNEANKIKHRQEMNKLNVKQLTNALKGCTALQ